MHEECVCADAEGRVIVLSFALAIGLALLRVRLALCKRNHRLGRQQAIRVVLWRTLQSVLLLL
jgi:hypothetical protein